MFRYLFRVRYSECDPQNVVFNARYSEFVDNATTEFIRVAWGGLAALNKRGYDFQVVRQLIEWRSPARFDDIICAEVGLVAIGTTSFTLKTAFTHRESGRAIAAAETVYVMVSHPDHQKTPIPEDVKARLTAPDLDRTTDHAGCLTAV